MKTTYRCQRSTEGISRLVGKGKGEGGMGKGDGRELVLESNVSLPSNCGILKTKHLDEIEKRLVAFGSLGLASAFVILNTTCSSFNSCIGFFFFFFFSFPFSFSFFFPLSFVVHLVHARQIYLVEFFFHY